jgi:malate synthase
MTDYTSRADLQVATQLATLVEQEVLPNLPIQAEDFWATVSDIFSRFSNENKALLSHREDLQSQIDQWHIQNREFGVNPAEYRQFLSSIGYLEPDCEDFTINTTNVDAEVAVIAGPQLVVPVKNARYALNAANARWGSLYDALYGTDVIAETEGAERGPGYNAVRGERVISVARNFLDETFPLNDASHFDALAYSVEGTSLVVKLAGNEEAGLLEPEQLAGYRGPAETPQCILLSNNGLHIEMQFDRSTDVGSTDAAGMSDILMESAVTTIQDCEDSVAAVDAEDKTDVYRNWLGLMSGQLKDSFIKGDRQLTRTLNSDRLYTDPDGKELRLAGRSLMFVRNVGHLMTTNAVLDQQGDELPEGILDGIITALIAGHDLQGGHDLRNSKLGSVYIVKPKMHGSAEVAFTDRLFEAIEDGLGYPRNTLKLGIMDEERRTTVNLKQCIHAARNRVVFINTGFLDRTGDEIHTSMQAGPFLPKEEIKQQPWILAYENRNVEIGLAAGFTGRAQIGKGMWASPDLMYAMLQTKIGHPRARSPPRRSLESWTTTFRESWVTWCAGLMPGSGAPRYLISITLDSWRIGQP